MPSHLSRAELDELDAALRARRRELREEIYEELTSRDNKLYAELAGQVHEVEEGAGAGVGSGPRLSFLERYMRGLVAVAAALTRLRQGRYGICEDTGEPIPFERLQVNPTATRTLDAQVRHEQQHPQPPTLQAPASSRLAPTLRAASRH